MHIREMSKQSTKLFLNLRKKNMNLIWFCSIYFGNENGNQKHHSFPKVFSHTSSITYFCAWFACFPNPLCSNYFLTPHHNQILGNSCCFRWWCHNRIWCSNTIVCTGQIVQNTARRKLYSPGTTCLSL